MQLGKLKEVEVRDLWKHEQYDFSEWLSKPENIEYLNEILGLTLTDIQKEALVGQYRCDIFAKDETSGVKVIIENQLETSNHDHLGKIITYASGLGASVIVWIVKEAREEHRSAIEWLNNNTVEDISFFLIELHAYQIGNSLPAPQFAVVEQPNGFIKLNKSGASTDKKDYLIHSQRLEFWTKMNDMLIAKGKPFNVKKPTTDHWYSVAIGSSECSLSINLVSKDSQVVVELYINNSKSLFDKLFASKDDIEAELGFTFIWDRLDNKKASRIKHSIDGLNFEDQSNYDALMEEIIDKISRMKKVFKKYL